MTRSIVPLFYFFVCLGFVCATIKAVTEIVKNQTKMNLAECSRLLCSRSAYDWIEGLHETEAGGTAVYKVR